MNIEEYIDKAIEISENGTDEGKLEGISMLEKELPNYPNHPRLLRNLAVIMSNYASGSTRRDYEGYVMRYKYAMRSLTVYKEISLEKMDIRKAWVIFMADQAGISACNSGDVNKMEEALGIVREACNLHMYEPIPTNQKMMNIGLPSVRAYLCYKLGNIYFEKGPHQHLNKASYILTEAYRILMNLRLTNVRQCDLNPNLESVDVIFTTTNITDLKQKVNQAIAAQPEPKRPTSNDAEDFINKFFKENSKSQKTTVKFCGNCGKAVNPGDRFCGNCGKPIG